MKNSKLKKLSLKRSSITELTARELRVTGGLVFCIPMPRTLPGDGDPLSIDCGGATFHCYDL